MSASAPTTERTRTGADAGPAKPPRLVSLDWARGWLIAINLVVIVYAVAPGASPQLAHSPWFGTRGFDLIFPAFVALSGCGLALAYRRLVPARTTARRVIVLLLLGLAYNAVLDRTTDLADLRVTGPLQVYAVLTLVVALLHLRVRSARAWGVLTCGWAVVLTGVHLWFDGTCALGQATRACNLSAATDLQWIPLTMLYQDGTGGHDPEGLVATAGAFVTLGVGITAGKILTRAWENPRAAAAGLLMWAGVVLGLGLLLAQVVEPVKRLWAPSFGLLAAVLPLAALIVGWVLHDVRVRGGRPLLPTRSAQLLIALGRNPLLLYFGAHIVLHELQVRGDPSVTERLFAADWPWGAPVTTAAALFTLAWCVVAWVLHRRRIYLRA